MKFPFLHRSSMPRLRLNPVVSGTSRRRWRPWMKKTAIIISGALIFLLLCGGIYYLKLRGAIQTASEAKIHAASLSSHIGQQDFTAAKTDIQHLQTDVQNIQRTLNGSKSLKFWPYLNRQYTAAVTLADVGDHALQAANPLIDFLAHLFEPFAGRGKVSLSNLTTEEKGILLAGISTKEEDLQAAQVAMHDASLAFVSVPKKGLVGPLQKVITPLTKQFPLLTQAIDQAIPASHIIPPLLGYPKEKTYLFLLQNNTELRPGGGFIGTYGLMHVSSGEIVSLKTDNSYNLDENAKKLSPIKPPDAIKKYLKQNAWYFRDSNWSPDFPTSAAQALFFYEREGGVKNADGVIAITPTTISELLRLVGSIKIGSIEFTADNFVGKLQEYVDKGYLVDGQTDSQRKDIIGVMTKELVDRLMKLPVTQWKDIFVVLAQQLNEKQFLMYMKDNATQSVVTQLNWGGAIDQSEKSDSLMVVDANLASLKTDSVMQRQYSYSVVFNGDQATAEVKIHYIHTGKFDWRTSYLISRYNTYVRVYVPSGSTLVSSSGAQIREKSNAPGQVTTSSELGKTVFAAYKSVEPETTSDLTLRYTLPSSIVQQLKEGSYRLAWQKEAGMAAPNITFHLDTPGQESKTMSGLDNTVKLGQSSLNFTGLLSQDRIISVTY